MKINGLRIGEWFARNTTRGIEVLTYSGEKVAGVYVTDMVCMLPFGPQLPVYQQHAAKIAAAPEMLEALEFLVALLPDPSLDTDAVRREYVQKAMAAIDKANGSPA